MMQYSNPYSFEKTDVSGQKINKILHLTIICILQSQNINNQNFMNIFSKNRYVYFDC